MADNKKLIEMMPMRMDFVWEVLGTDDETRTARVAVRPNPDRYERVEKGGRISYYDKFLHLSYPQELVDSMMRQMVGMPLSYTPPLIDSSLRYAQKRIEAITQQIQSGSYQPPSEKPAPHKPLATAQGERDISFLSVDICGSTALRVVNREGYDRAHQLFLQEMGTVIGQFHGSIHKLTGDGFIAYFDTLSANSRSDNTVDCGLSLMAVLGKGLNLALESAGLPGLQIRVGADHGSASIKTYVVESTGYSGVDVASDALNRAVKIQEAAGAGEFWIGWALYQGLHTQWLSRALPVDYDGAAELGIAGYRVFRVA